jgi:hypothetical protein
LVNLTNLLAHWMIPSYLLNQSMPIMMPISLESKG